jgi:hypothetical protein
VVGISLLVTCGIGRAIAVAFSRDLPERWRFESIAAHDPVTLSWVSDFDALSLWRLFGSREMLERQGTVLMNVNGILNLFAWANDLRGHLVPHNQLPSDSVPPGLVLIQQNILRTLRQQVGAEWSPRRALDLSGKWIRVRRLGRSEFAEDNATPMYGSEEDLPKGKLRGV